MSRDCNDPVISKELVIISVELVEKAVLAGCPTLVTVSAPTALAIERAREAGLRLIALARPDAMLVAS